MNKYILVFIVLFTTVAIAQDSTQSVVIKNNRTHSNYPLIKPAYPTYPLMAGFLLVQAANEGDPIAEHELGIRYLLGRGFPADTVKAIKWIKKASDKNLPQAKFNYGIMLNQGIGPDWDPFEAFENFMFAANRGMPESQYAVGIYYTDNLVVNRNYNQAYKWIKKAADNDLEYAKETLTKLEESGLVTVTAEDSEFENYTAPKISVNNSSLINQDYQLDFFDFDDDSLSEEEEIESLNELVTKNKSELIGILGIAEKVLQDSSRDTTAFGLIELAAQNGSPEALFIAGRYYQRGIVVEKDMVKAAVYFVRAYRLGSYKSAEYLLSISQEQSFFDMLKDKIDNQSDPDAMFAWAGLVALGFDFQLSGDQSIDMLKTAAEKDHIPSIIEIGLAYYSGTLVEKNKDEAFEYWEQAVKLGSQEAKIRLAFTNILDNEENLPSNFGFLIEAADEGSVLAQTALGYCYENGVGTKKHIATAADYYKSAAYRGNRTAFSSLKKLYDDLRHDDEIFQIYEKD